jgi:hypothetical protein
MQYLNLIKTYYFHFKHLDAMKGNVLGYFNEIQRNMFLNTPFYLAVH